MKQYYFSMAHRPLLKALLWVLLVFLQIHQHMGCLQEERIGLLELKAFLQSNIHHAGGRLLPSWINDTKSECCGWERVTCNSTTAHVIKLSLDNINHDPYYYESYNYEDYNNRWMLNVSLFLPFKELTTLDLSANAISGCLPNEGFEKMSSLRNLKILDLGYNYFDNSSILQFLGAVTSLETLILTSNKLQGYFSAQELIGLRKLNKLDISENNFNGSLPLQGFESLSKLEKLETLYLNGNNFDIRIIESLSAVKTLKNLNLAWNWNHINGSFPAKGFESLSRLENLEILYLNGNAFDIRIIKSLSAVKTLKILNLAWIRINGSFPAQGFESLSRLEKLETLYLNGNNFDIRIIESLSAIKTLKNLDLGLNHINGSFPTQGFENLSRFEKLETLDLYENNFDIRIIESLSAIKTLKNLNLASNHINGSFPTQGFENLSRLENLETLDLSDNYFDIRILESLSAIKTLKTLNLASNNINGAFLAQGFENLSRLENLETLNLFNNYFDIRIIESLSAVKTLKTLDLSWNGIKGSFPVQGLSNFSRLEILDLTGNSFSGSISPSIGVVLSSLKAISLANNQLNGTLPKELCALKKLEELDLYGNLFEGILPPCLNNMMSLRLLDISHNQFTGNISSSMIAISTSLRYIDLSYNYFEGLFKLSLFANHSKLKVFILASENNKLEIEPENSVGWDFSFQLKVLVLRNCNLNKLTRLPEFLFDQRELEIIDLAHNKLKGGFPIWLLENNTGLRQLHLRNNSFVGKFHLSRDHCKRIWFMDVSDNCLDGQLQENIGKIAPYFQYLDLSRNHFKGYLPSSIGDMTHLVYLDLSFNNFSGELPKELFANCTSLEFLKLCNNQFTGKIPGWIGNMTRLPTFLMSKNSLEGQIPCGLVDYLELLDLSHNSLSGLLPSCLNLQSVKHLRLQGNKLTGPLPKAIFNSSSLLTLDLRDNSFFGSIPSEIGALSNLRILLLRDNNFSGIIPNQMCWLNKIGIMDLSKNSLSGTIPDCFHNMSFGKKVVDDFVYNEGIYVAWSTIEGSIFQRPMTWDFESKNLAIIEYGEHVEVDFVTKYMNNSYIGDILDYMSGLDLSCNKLTGRIPPELGELSFIHALNLSYNQLTGHISQTFSNLANLESLDLSHNNLSGEIPSVLIDLTFLEVFTVAYNNLSDKVPERKAQFATFDKKSYQGNPFLCGQPLENSCTRVDESHPSPTKSSNASEGKWYEVDPQVFFASFIASYVIFFLGASTLLYIHPYLQQRCFNLLEDFKYRCYYPILYTLKRLSNCLYP